MKSDIRVCSAWHDRYGRPVYSLSETCPECGATTESSASAPYSPEDPHDEYRRARKCRLAEKPE